MMNTHGWRLLIALLAPMACSSSLSPAAAPDASSDPVPSFQLIELGLNEPFLYPRNEDVMIDSIGTASGGVVIALASDLPRFSHFSYAIDGSDEQRANSSTIAMIFSDPHSLVEQRAAMTVWAHDDSGYSTLPHELVLSYASPEMYAQNGRSQRGGVVIERTDMPRVSGRVVDWIIEEPSAEDVAFARLTWGNVVEREESPQTRAETLARAILDILDPHRGVPSDWMKTARPFDQYRRAISGEDHVWCDNFARIFVHAALSFQIPARIVEMPGRIVDTDSALSVSLADGHTSSEIFDEVANRWIWMDLTIELLSAELEERGPVTIAALHRYLTDPDIRSELRLKRYDPRERVVSTDTVTPAEARAQMMRFFNRDQTYQYLARPDVRYP